MTSLKMCLAVALSVSAPAALADDDPCNTTTQAGQETVTLGEAIARAQEADLRPDLADAAVRAAQTERAVASLRPADTVELEIEDFPGFGLASNIDNLQITGRFSRVWERGGKRQAREALADASVGVARADALTAEYDIRREVETIFLEAAIAQERVQLACERVTIASGLEAIAERRVEAARDPLLSGARATSERLQAEADAHRYEAEARNLRAALGSYWAAETDFRVVHRLPEPDASGARVDVSALYVPELDQLSAQRARASAEIDLERTKAIPDVTWNVGVRKFGIEQDLAVIGGASIPLGAPARSATETARLRAQQRTIQAEMDVIRQQLLREAVVYQRAILSAADDIAKIDTVLLPAASESVALAENGYNRGALSYLDVIDAQRTVAALREDRLTLLRTYLLNQAALMRLVASSDRNAGLETE